MGSNSCSSTRQRHGYSAVNRSGTKAFQTWTEFHFLYPFELVKPVCNLYKESEGKSFQISLES